MKLLFLDHKLHFLMKLFTITRDIHGNNCATVPYIKFQVS